MGRRNSGVNNRTLKTGESHGTPPVGNEVEIEKDASHDGSRRRHLQSHPGGRVADPTVGPGTRRTTGETGTRKTTGETESTPYPCDCHGRRGY